MRLFASIFRRLGIITLFVFGIVLLASGLLTAGTAAHGPEVLVKTDPPDGTELEQSPAQVMAWFNTELNTQLSSIQVVDIYHHQVDNGDGGVDLNDPDHASMVVSLPTLPEGVYIVRWNVVTAGDGDLVGGVFTFSVGDSALAPDQISTVQTPPDGITTGWLLILMAVGLGVLLLVMFGVVLYARLVRDS